MTFPDVLGTLHSIEGHHTHEIMILELFISRPQSITQKGVHAHPLTAWEREHWFFVAFESFSDCEFWASIARTPFCANYGALPI